MVEKTYRAIRHDIVRKKQEQNSAEVHHPDQKINQIYSVLDNSKKYKILELFCGRENLTKHYKKFGEVELYDKKWKKTGDSYKQFHRLIWENKKYHPTKGCIAILKKDFIKILPLINKNTKISIR